MKRKLAYILATMLLVSMSVSVYAAGTTTLTTTVPAATYTLIIPSDMEIPFGQLETEIGDITVTDANGFADGKNLQVTLTYDSFKSDDVSTTIPYIIKCRDGSYAYPIMSGEYVYFEGTSSGTLESEFNVVSSSNSVEQGNTIACFIESNDWGKALAGDYSSTITFTAEVVVE